MLQAYQGYFLEETRFLSDNSEIKIPPNRRVIINILTDEIETKENTEYLTKLDNAVEEARTNGAYQYFGNGNFSETRKRIEI